MREPLSVDEVVERVRRRLREASVPGLVSVYLFGSYARDAAHRESDVDVAVLLDDAPPLLGRRIVEDGRRLLCADADADRAFAIRVKIRAADVLPWYRRHARIKLDAIRR